MKKNSDERLRKYLNALEKTNKNLIIALKTMYKYTYTIEKTNKDLLNQLESQVKTSDTTLFGKELDKSSMAYRLIDLIMDMPEDEQEDLLAQIEERILQKEVRDHFRKPFFMSVNYATCERSYNDFIKDISAGGLFIETRRPFSIGQDIVLTFPFPEDRKHIKISGEIVRTTENGIGVRFRMSEQEQRQLTECLMAMV
jgi:Tfp pilus assembly protein PilZ